MSAKSVLESKARRLAAKFVEDSQALFDDPRMTGSIYEGEVFCSLIRAQEYAVEVGEHFE